MNIDHSDETINATSFDATSFELAEKFNKFIAGKKLLKIKGSKEDILEFEFEGNESLIMSIPSISAVGIRENPNAN